MFISASCLAKVKGTSYTFILSLSLLYQSYPRPHVAKPGCSGLVVKASDSRSRGRGFDPDSGRCVVSSSKTHSPKVVLVIPRKRRLRPNMTENLFTGSYVKHQIKQNVQKIPSLLPFLYIKQ